MPTIEKIVAVVNKKLQRVWTITTFFAVSCVVCDPPYHRFRLFARVAGIISSRDALIEASLSTEM